MIRTSSLSKSYGDFCALADLSLNIEEGEFYAFLGPNGAGKTTTIKLLTGLLAPSSGSAVVAGFDVMQNPIEAKRSIGYIPDVAFFYDKLTCLEFMQFIGELFEVPPGQVREQREALFERLSLDEYRNHRVENLSHGTKQRLAISAALMHEPKVIIIDEPMVGLDPKHARVVKDELISRAKAGATVFMSTHQLATAEELADRIGILNRGRLIIEGTRDEIADLRRGAAAHTLEDFFLQVTAED